MKKNLSHWTRPKIRWLHKLVLQQKMKMAAKFVVFACIALLIGPNDSSAQQVADMDFHYANKSPAYEKATGPRLLIDKAHSPYIARGAYEPFLKLVNDDGYNADYLTTKITENTLDDVQILVIANPYRKDFGQFSIMQPPSAYQVEEIATIRNWVIDGGRLLLIADHAPFAGGAAALAESFGYTYFNGYVLADTLSTRGSGEIAYDEFAGLNIKHPIINQASATQKIEKFVIFTGSAFIAPPEAKPVLTIPGGYIALMTQSVRSADSNTPRIDVSGLSQGATLELGKGKLAVFAEAGSFTAQIVNGKSRFGMNVARAEQNPVFVLSTLRWLAR